MESAQTQLNLYGLNFPNKETELTKLEKKVLNLLPVGKENAISSEDIINTLGIKKRTLTDTIRNLRLKSRDVGSTTNDGYWVFKNPNEYLEFMSKYSKEQNRRKQVEDAMRLTPMAQKITVEMNSTTNQKNKKKE